MKTFLLSILTLVCISCNTPQKKENTTNSEAVIQIEPVPHLDLAQANRLASLPLACINTEFPNKLNQTLGGEGDLKTPSVLHPAFYGCFDWHSSVHGHWSLVSLLKRFPNLNDADHIKERLLANISAENILTEVAYFDNKHNSSFERTYGWAWLLKLAEELHTWSDPVARTLEQNLQPLTDLIVEKYLEFLPKLNYPIRVGEHPNTAFGLSFAWDYASEVGNEKLMDAIRARALFFYKNDTACPLGWEPGGYDFLSPCLEEAALMKRVLPEADFETWVHDFLPQLADKNFVLAVGEVSDRSDGKLVHLDGVNFSRAWSLYKIAENMPKYAHLKNVANAHINYSLPNIVGDSYEGGHWLGSFAIYALSSIHSD
ncbi:DUF2891 domain-containing protein [Flavobacteriaceae bacterium F08102]|nr:DUF2891 domain-containing protein [Flavobacteriaceae bacterium F08102]